MDPQLPVWNLQSYILFVRAVKLGAPVMNLGLLGKIWGCWDKSVINLGNDESGVATLFGACPNFLSKWNAISAISAQATFSFRNMLSRISGCLKKSTRLQCPLCQQADSALNILSGCQHTIISGMITERHNVACRHIIKAISKGSLEGCLVHLDAGSTDCLSLQAFQRPRKLSFILSFLV